MAKELTDRQVRERAEKSRPRRMAWWHEARFGMFVHWGLYSQLGRHEWVMNRERIPLADYEKLADSWKPRPRPMREWARLAVDAGMKYMVMTTKHHEGFCLWDTNQTDYNAAKRGPGRDLVGEFVESCREAGLRIGFYYSLMDWHHPDGARCAKDERARRRFLDFTQGCVRELVSNYGKIDILWYDVSWPLSSPRLWESARMNAMVRRIQPEIIINNRSQLPEDFGTPEEHIAAADAGRAWEACMTFNGSWGYFPTAPESDWHSTREVLGMLREVTGGSGNLLLNIGPAPDGSAPAPCEKALVEVGDWLQKYGAAVYDAADPMEQEWQITGAFTRRGDTAYFHCNRWPGKELAIGGLANKVLEARLLGGPKVEFSQVADRLVLRGLPEKAPNPLATVVELKVEGTPRQVLGAGHVLI